MAADGSIVIDTRIDTAGFGKGAANLKSQFAALGTSAKKLGALIAAAFSVTAIVNFAKEAIELGSDLQEVQNVVDVTFTTLNEQVNEFAKNAATTAGLSETMAKQYVGTFGAMAKSFQFTEEEAYNMSTALTQLAGDVASFYNITQDTAYTKLKSVFTGETESLKDLGVVMTQTALDDYALRKGLGKTTSEMTEQEKVALRYQFVLEQLSAASGDFIRTQDGWANQTRILSLQFDQLKATLGQGLINALTPALKVINQLISKLQTAAEAFRDFTAALFGDAGDASSAIESVTESTEEYGDAIEESAKQAKKALAPFDEIIKLGSESSDTETTSSVSVSTAVTGSGETITAETIAPGLQDAVDTILALIEPLKNIDFSNVAASFDRLKESVLPFSENLFSGLKWAWDNLLVPLAEWTIEEAVPKSVNALAAAFTELETALDPVAQALEENELEIENTINGLQTTIAEAFATIKTIASDIGQSLTNGLTEFIKENEDEITLAKSNLFKILAGITNTVSVVVKDVFSDIKTWWNKEGKPIFDQIISVFKDVGAWILRIWNEWISPVLNYAKTEFDKLWQNTLRPLFNKILSLFTQVGATLKAVWDAMKPFIDWLISTLTPIVKDTFKNMIDSVTNAVDVVAELLGGFIDGLKGVLQFLEGAFSGDWEKAWDGLKTAVKSPINAIIGFLNTLISAVVDGINTVIKSFNAISFELPDWGILGDLAGKKFGLNIKTITAPKIPYLAQGAVIPPNAPFMAVLGDQRHGTNIEAPLSTIQEAVALVMEDMTGGMMAGFEATVAVLKEILEAVYGIEIGDDVIGKAVARYNSKISVSRGG